MTAIVGKRQAAKALAIARDELQWFHTVRITELDISAMTYEAKDTYVWDSARLGVLHDRQLALTGAVRRARAVAAVLGQLPIPLQQTARDRWLSFPAQYAAVVNAFRTEGENGTYLGIVLTLDSAKEALDHERIKYPARAPRTVLEMLQVWAPRASSTKIDPLRREAIRRYGRVVHEYAAEWVSQKNTRTA